VPAAKQVYFDLVAAPEGLAIGDLVMALDAAVHATHALLRRSLTPAEVSAPWSVEPTNNATEVARKPVDRVRYANSLG
jgi:hypothetical protein